MKTFNTIRGFTLVEVLIALLVLTVSVSSLFYAYRLALSGVGKSIEAQQSIMLSNSYYSYLNHQSSSQLKKDFEDQCKALTARNESVSVVHQPPMLAGSPYLGLNNIYESYSVEITFPCTGLTDSRLLANLAIMPPSGQKYEFDMAMSKLLSEPVSKSNAL